MKKLLSLLLVCALSAPLFAGAVTLTSVDNGDGTCTINMEITDGSVVGVALDVAVDAGADLTDVVFDPFYNCYIDAAYDEETGGDGYTYGEGQPVCLVDAPGATNIATAMAGSRVFAVCAGGLGGETAPLTPAPAAPTTVALLTLTGADGAAGTIDLNVIRGGIVCADATAATVTGVPLSWTITASTDPECWSYPCHSKGDVNGDGVLTYTDDVQPLIDAWNGEYDPCVDFNHDGVLTYTGDVQVLIDNWGTTLVCE